MAGKFALSLVSSVVIVLMLLCTHVITIHLTNEDHELRWKKVSTKNRTKISSSMKFYHC